MGRVANPKVKARQVAGGHARVCLSPQREVSEGKKGAFGQEGGIVVPGGKCERWGNGHGPKGLLK